MVGQLVFKGSKTRHFIMKSYLYESLMTFKTEKHPDFFLRLEADFLGDFKTFPPMSLTFVKVGFHDKLAIKSESF